MSEELVSSQAVGGIPSLTEGQIFHRGVTELVLFLFKLCMVQYWTGFLSPRPQPGGNLRYMFPALVS